MQRDPGPRQAARAGAPPCQATRRASGTPRRPAAPGVDGDPSAGRPAPGRLPHPVPRLRPRPRRPARIPVPRRRAPHRLERHRAHADALRAAVQRGPRGRRLVPARPWARVDFGSRRTKRACRAEFVAVLARMLTRHGNRWARCCTRAGRHRAACAQRPAPRAANCCNAWSTPPTRGRRRTRRTCATAEQAQRSIPRRSLVFVVSDFISTPGWGSALACSPSGTRCWPFASTTRWRWSCPTSASS